MMSHVFRSAFVSALTLLASAAGATPLTPSGDDDTATIQGAIDALGSGGGMVELGEGTFKISAQIAITNAVTLVGAGRDKTTVQQTVTKAEAAMVQRVFYVNNANAVLEGLTISGGYAYAGGSGVGNNGTGVLVDANGGTIRNCRVTDNYMGMNVYSAVYLNSKSALMERTIVDNNKSLNTYDNKYGFPGTGVYVTGGATVRNCLFYGNVNQSSARNYSMPAVYANNGTVINCTITGNTGINGSGAYAVSSGKFYNCIVYGNTYSQTVKDYTGSAEWDGTAANFIACTFTDPNFKDSLTGDYHLKSDSTAIGVGNTTAVDLTGVKDLDGVACLKDNKTDLGCYQYVPDGTVNFEIKVLSDLKIYTNGSVSFKASVDGDDPANYTYAWTFGEGGPAASGQTPTVTFPNSGRYYATLTVRNEQGVDVFTDTYTEPVIVAREVISLEDGDSLDDALDEVLAGCKIVMGAGTFSMTASKTLPARVTMTGAGPDQTTLNLGAKQLVLNDAASYLAGCKVTGCDIAMNVTGGGVVIDTDGGVVSNCWFDASKSTLAFNSKGLCVTVKSAKGQVTHCLFTNNDMTFKNTAYGSCIAMTAGLVDNCLFHDNKSINGGAIYISGGTIRNCTIMNNKAAKSTTSGYSATAWYGGGVYIDAASGITLQNCIIYGNTADTSGDDWYCSKALTDEQREAMFVNCCLSNPMVDETYHLTISSGATCINKGLGYVGDEDDTDLDFKARVSGDEIDIGCYEYVSTSTFTCEMVADKSASFPGDAVGFHAYLDAEVDPADYTFAWDFDEEGLVSSQQNPTVCFNELGSHDVTLVITKTEDGSEVFRKTCVGMVCVNTKTIEIGANDDLYAALAHPVDGQVFLLKGSEYVCTNEVVVTNGITIRGLGREATVLRMASGINKRFFTLNAADAVLADLAMENGGFSSLPKYNATYGGLHGGGVLIDAKGGTVENCRISGCQVGMNGKGMGLYLNSASARATRCIVNDNYTVNNYPSGGALTVEKGCVDSCLVVSNRITAATRDYYMSAGISVIGGTASNCTASANAGHGVGGILVTGGAAVNCIAFGNSVAKSAGTLPDTAEVSGEKYCDHCIFTDPKFVDAANGDYHLEVTSGAVNAGVYGSWMTTATDLDGLPRLKRTRVSPSGVIVKAWVDCGCYEAHNAVRGFQLILR